MNMIKGFKMETNPDNSPVSTDFQKVFHLD